MDVGYGDAAAFVYVFFELALAAVLLAVRFNSPANRALALFLVLFALYSGCGVMARLTDDPGAAAYWTRVQPYFLGFGFAAGYLGCVYPQRQRWLPRAPWGELLFAVPFVAYQLAYAMDHVLYLDWSRAVSVPGQGLVAPPGPLLFLSQGGPGTLLIVLFVLLTQRSAAGLPPGRRRTSVLLLSTGLAMFFTHRVFSLVAQWVVVRPLHPFPESLGWYDVQRTLYALYGVGMLAHTAWFALRGSDAWVRSRFRLALGVLLAAAASGLADGAIPGAGGLQYLWNGAFPFVVTYALLRHQLFDIDLKVKWTLRRGTLAAMFLAVFFVVGQLAQNYLSQTYDLLLGGVAAGLLLFALNPLQRAAERVADTAMPRTRVPGELGLDERRRVYREAVEEAWADGALEKQERRLLERLRESLRLSTDEATRLEREVVRA